MQLAQEQRSTGKNHRILSGSVLKLIAMITMLIDHVTLHLLSDVAWLNEPLFTLFNTQISVFYLLRSVGRLAFPLYCFLLTEGFIHTKNRTMYGVNLFLFALLSELPWNFVHNGTLLYEGQNVFFTLFLGYCGLCLMDSLKDRPAVQVTGLVLLFFLAYCLGADYGYMGYGLILVMYALRTHPAVRAVVGTCMLSSTWRGGLAFLPIALYNGQRGFIRGRVGKYACYAFYPLHLLLIGISKFYACL